MVLTEELKQLVEEVPFVPITTVSSAGAPHLIVVGQVKEIRKDDILVFGIYKMEETQKNIKDNGKMQVVLASNAADPEGYRLIGEACIEEDDEVLFKAEKAESLL